MWLKARRARIGHHWFMQFQAHENDCANCGMRKRCLRNEQQKTPRQINVALEKRDRSKEGEGKNSFGKVGGEGAPFEKGVPPWERG